MGYMFTDFTERNFKTYEFTNFIACLTYSPKFYVSPITRNPTWRTTHYFLLLFCVFSAVAKDRGYDKPWSTNAKRTPAKSVKDPKRNSSGKTYLHLLSSDESVWYYHLTGLPQQMAHVLSSRSTRAKKTVTLKLNVLSSKVENRSVRDLKKWLYAGCMRRRLQNNYRLHSKKWIKTKFKDSAWVLKERYIARVQHTYLQIPLQAH